ncbi:MAG: DUF5681 domain-containing protein [Rudaea sp.]|nr:DUF5681 domain-containing protein [Rudaea sp.]
MTEPLDPSIGYRHPPESGRYRPGQSGNPRGRPKGSTNLSTEITKIARERITVTENGRLKQITKLQAIGKQLTNLALKGDLAAVRLLVSVFQMAEQGTAPGIPAHLFSEADHAVVKQLMNRLPTLNEESPNEPDLA